MRPGSGLEQLSHFADRLVNSKCNIARHKSFAAIPSKPELETHPGKKKKLKYGRYLVAPLSFSLYSCFILFNEKYNRRMHTQDV